MVIQLFSAAFAELTFPDLSCIFFFLLTLLSDNDGFEAINSVGMPGMNRTDDNIGIGSLTCTGTDALTWVSEVTTSRTWNTERFSERGRLLGIEAVFCDANEIWYGGGNIHRTAFGGRNNQYYAEDGNYGYLIEELGARILQTDRPGFMLDYLRKKGLHD